MVAQGLYPFYVIADYHIIQVRAVTYDDADVLRQVYETDTLCIYENVYEASVSLWHELVACIDKALMAETLAVLQLYTLQVFLQLGEVRYVYAKKSVEAYDVIARVDDFCNFCNQCIDVAIRDLALIIEGV